MHILIAPQALKGSLTARETGQAIAAGVQTIFPRATQTILPIADGGEGTVQALVDATGGRIITRKVTGPLGETVEAFFGILGDAETAVIEMAACAGLPLVPTEKCDPRITTTYGVGELILAALDLNCHHILLGIGGSATNDGGAGMAQALGATLTTVQDRPIAPGGAALHTLAHINTEHMDKRLSACIFEIACDVTNPLCGPEGATAIYGPQKGASQDMITSLDAALAHYARVILHDLHKDVAQHPGSGAAGGLGAGMLAFLPATLRPGAQIVLETLHLEQKIAEADLIITAEGQLDEQTAYGKSISAVSSIAQRYRKPIVAIAGGLGKNYHTLYQSGLTAAMALPTGPMSLTYAMEHASALTRDATERALRLLQAGISMR